MLRTTSSPMSRVRTPSLRGVARAKKLTTFCPYSWEAWPGRRPGRSVYPMMNTPFSVLNTSPGRVSSQLPPVEAPMSTMTEPGFICRTASAVMSSGAGLPGIWAVVTTMSDSIAWRV